VIDLLKAGRAQSEGNALTTLATLDGVPHVRPREPIAGTGNKEWQSDCLVLVLGLLLQS
jgi:hypothetical protein